MKPAKATNKKRGPEQSEGRKAFEAAGMSRHRMYQALAVASIPKAEFEELTESDNPPTITELTRIGKRKPKRPEARRLKTCPHCGGDLTADA